MTRTQRLGDFLLQPVDAASLVAFRVAFGGILVWQALLYVRHDLIGQLWIQPPFHFTYYGFGWVRPWPGTGMYVHFALFALGGLLVAAGLWYRIGAALAWLGLTYVFLLEQALYLNHIYLLCLVCLLMLFVPAHRLWSMDARRRPGLRAPTVPRWALGVLQFQVSVAYVYAGLAKLNGDWLAGEPMRLWLFERTEDSFLAPLMTREPVVYLVSYGGLLFDLAVVPLLIWRRTRPAAFTIAVLFHLSNAWLFPLGVFPWFMLAATTLLLAPDWPRRVFGGKRVANPAVLRGLPTAPSGRRTRSSLTLTGIFVAVQLLVPLRHHLYPGDVAWTEEGHRFAWRMRVRDKVGAARFLVRPAGGTTEFEANTDSDLTPWQEGAMVNRPDLILQFAHHLGRRISGELGRPVEVRVESVVSLNGRPYRPLIDAEVDLAAEPRTLGPARWILPSGPRANER
jgi:hypothetical protein